MHHLRSAYGLLIQKPQARGGKPGLSSLKPSQSPSIQQIVSWASWSRIDARLGEILVAWLTLHFRRFNLLELADRNRAAPCPQALNVIFEFVSERIATERPSDLASINSVLAAIASGVKPAPLQMFFLSDGKPEPARDLDLIKINLQAYQKWGFVGEEGLVSLKVRSQNRSRAFTTLSRASRLQRLELLIRGHETLSVADYLEACQFAVHPRTAERDLLAHPRLKPKGATRARRFTVVRR